MLAIQCRDKNYNVFVVDATMYPTFPKHTFSPFYR